MAQLDSTEFKAQTASLYADNTSGDISAADLRAQMDNIADSASFKTTDQVDAPGATDDVANTGGRGAFDAGDIWVDITNDIAYVCVDSTATSAIWGKITALTGAEIKALYEAEADTNAFTDALLAKLTGIEDNATADQTGAEIKALYEAEADTNAFDDAAVAKLAGIDTGAADDQTGAEIKALYEAEADTNAFTDAEQTKLSGIEDNATADQIGPEIKALYEAEADTNAFTDAEQTKLSQLNAVNTQTGTSYTLSLVDNGGLVTVDNAAANTVTIDPVVTTAYPVGYIATIIILGTGTTTITAGAGVSLNGVTANSVDIGSQYYVVTVYHVATDTWVVDPDKIV